MKDNRTQKVKDICKANIEDNCRTTCPLSKPCIIQHGDTKEVYDARVNKAAELIDRKIND